MNKTEQYVYDLETENHHFQGGIGELICHNTDGSHIKGLVINYIACFWPNLLSKNLVCSLLTPIVKVFKGQRINNFYNVQDYEKWKKETRNSSSWRVKYYKGLGTSTAKEAKEYFLNLANNKIDYTYDKIKGSDDTVNLELAFSDSHKKNTDKRKVWITKTMKLIDEQQKTGIPIVDYNEKVISIGKFVKGELALFSLYDNQRSIPHFIDGLKPSQRKILYACLKRNLFLKPDKSGELKVAQLSGYVSEHSGYHHGEVSLQGAIINMAQDYTGSNNLNILHPNGQFGTRIKGGKDAASARYIFTYLNDWVKTVFNKYDNELLNYLDDDGSPIEPDFYVPTIPMLLVNGSEGIGTGWSTNIPSYNPKDIINNLKNLLDDEDSVISEMTPWYKGFKGTIEKVKRHTWVSRGVFKRMKPKNSYQDLLVTELPIGLATDDFKNHLVLLEQKEDIISFEDHSDDTKVDFTVKFKKLYLSKTNDNDICKLLKLCKNINDSNMHAFQCDGSIKKYECAEEILWDFYKYRKGFYIKRKEHIQSKMEKELKQLSEKLRFITMVISEEIKVFRRKKTDIAEDLKTHSFKKMSGTYGYLLDIRIHAFTQDKLDELGLKIESVTNDLEILYSKTPNDLWLEDLSVL
jgi:DNA topoisomerase-2